MTESTPPGDFAARLRACRDQKSLSQAQLAEKSGLQPTAISHFENGRRAPSFANLRALSDALSVSTDYLLGRDDDPGAVGPAMQRMFRHLSHLSDADQALLEEFAKTLAAKTAREGKAKPASGGGERGGKGTKRKGAVGKGKGKGKAGDTK